MERMSNTLMQEIVNDLEGVSETVELLLIAVAGSVASNHLINVEPSEFAVRIDGAISQLSHVSKRVVESTVDG